MSMTFKQHLLVILAEECAEAAQLASKCIRFGIDQTRPGQDKTNRQRLEEELADIIAMSRMLNLHPPEEKMIDKVRAVSKYADLSRQLGQL